MCRCLEISCGGSPSSVDVALCKCSSVGRLLGAYNLRVMTPRALVYAGLMTSGDARSWYMISGDAKSWIGNQSQGMSTPTYVDSETITQADGAQSSRVPIPLPDDPYVAIDPGTEFEASELLGTRTVSSHSLVSSDSTSPFSPDHPLSHVSPTPTPTRVCFTIGPHVSSYETQSPSSSPTLHVRKKYRGTSELILDTDNEEGQGLDDEGQGLDVEGQGSEDEGPGMKEAEEAAYEGQQQAVPVVDTAASEPLGLGYEEARSLFLNEECNGKTRVGLIFDV
ncbi:hypothetical protein Tco_0593819 [Tanacetum coccineum]